MCNHQCFQKYICSLFCLFINEYINVFKSKYKGKELEQQNMPCEHFFFLPCKARVKSTEKKGGF